MKKSCLNEKVKFGGNSVKKTNFTDRFCGKIQISWLCSKFRSPRKTGGPNDIVLFSSLCSVYMLFIWRWQANSIGFRDAVGSSKIEFERSSQ